jgi:hypothetical protein
MECRVRFWWKFGHALRRSKTLLFWESKLPGVTPSQRGRFDGRLRTIDTCREKLKIKPILANNVGLRRSAVKSAVAENG